MDKVQALAIKSFDYGGIVRTYKSGAFLIDRRDANVLAQRGLLRIVKSPTDPLKAAGEQQSALPAAQASQPQTSSASGAGGRRGRPRKQDA